MTIKIELTTSSLGDTIASIGQVDKYQKLTNHNVHFIINSKYVELFKTVYPNISFDEPVKYDELKVLHVNLDQPLEKYASDLLGLPFEETCAKVVTVIKERPIKEKYFTISTQSTHQGRYWNAKKGWNILLNLLKQRYGLTAVCVDMYSSYGTKDCYNTIPAGAIDKTGISLLESTHYMNHAEFHIGTSNGLSWLAHAVGKKVVLITNVTKKWCEFTTNVVRVDNESVCHGCLNEKPFDKYDWNWCPNHKNTKRMFECTTSISPHDVFEKIKNNISIIK
jgi:autotransporter strand-loop-strand O-heptosyltransferase